MSAGSPKRSDSHSRTSTSIVVSPQQVADPTILDSVAGFINEVATYNVQNDFKDFIQWVKFEQIDYDEYMLLENLDSDKIHPPPLILVLGYTSGIQVWAVPVSGEATEILSWRHGSVRVLRFLPAPHAVGRASLTDLFGPKRPLIALCDNAAPGPHYCSLSFLSLKTGEQVKVIKFKNPIVDVLANRRSVVVAFSERIAVFDSFTLEDRLTVTTCYLSPGIHPNPIALGTRWMAYAEKKLISAKRSSGGNEGEGVQSYTATMIHAAKTLGKGLRELGETVASSLTGNAPHKPSGTSGNSLGSGSPHSETIHKGVVTVLDLENQNVEDGILQAEGVIAHFIAHTEAIVCLSFDPSGLLLFTADKQGHDFHLFKIHPHPGGPALAAVHHLYVLHRGDTTARVQNVSFSPDSRWIAVSTLRGTTHVFPITPYGGNVGVRTHASPHVVNKLSRFHRSAGLNVEGRSHSPVSLFEAPVNSNLPYHNPRLPPYPHPTIVHPLAQIRQPLFVQNTGNSQQRPHSGRPRLSSSSEDNVQVALRVCTMFAPPRAWFESLIQPADISLNKMPIKPVESLFVMSCYGTLTQYDLDPHHLFSVPKEKVCDETPIELSVTAKAQWTLQRQPNFVEHPLPLSDKCLELITQKVTLYKRTKPLYGEDQWLSQVEIITHAGPHRRLWMGPQFTFKTYNTCSSSPLSINEAQAVDVGRSKPVNMPLSTTYPVVIESGSASSCEQSPKLFDTYHSRSESRNTSGDMQLKEDLADAMLESPGVRESGGHCVIVSMKPQSSAVIKVVNPLGTVVTLQSDDETEVVVTEEVEIHENCDEALFRPVVTPKLPFSVRSAPEIAQPAKHAKRKTSKATSVDEVPVAVESVENEAERSSLKKQLTKLKVNEKKTDNSSSESEDNRKKAAAIKKKNRKPEGANKKTDLPFKESSSIQDEGRMAKENKNLDVSRYNEINDSSMSEKEETKQKQKKKVSQIESFVDISGTDKCLEEFEIEKAIGTLEKEKTKVHEEVVDFDLIPSLEMQVKVEENKKKFKPEKYQGLELNEIIFSSEEEEKYKKTDEKAEKVSTKKPRKPKPKLGVRLGKVKDASDENKSIERPKLDFPTLETASDDLSDSMKPDVEVTITLPKRSWSSVVSSKPPSEKPPDLPELPKPLDLPEIEDVEHIIKELPGIKRVEGNLLDLNEQDDPWSSCSILHPEKVYHENVKIKKVDKLLSDDEHSSFTEATESDDSGKVSAEKEEKGDDSPLEEGKTVQGKGRSARRKAKNKKR